MWSVPAVVIIITPPQGPLGRRSTRGTENSSEEMANDDGSSAGSSNGSSQGQKRPTKRLDSVVIRFAGDSGDGMQLTGTEFTRTAALYGNDIATFPDFPAEIRAPAGSLAGVSGFQLQFSSNEIFTRGRRARGAGRDEPGGAAHEPAGPGARGDPDRQHRRVQGQEPGARRLREEPARGRLARGLPRGPDRLREARADGAHRRRHVDPRRRAAPRTSSRSACCSGCTAAIRCASASRSARSS